MSADITQRIFAYLDGEMDSAAAARFEAEAARDPRVARELAGCRSLFGRLGALPSRRPRAGFACRVVAGWRMESAGRAGALAGLAGRPGWLRALARDPFGALAEGALSRRQARAVAAYARRDPDAAAELEAAHRLLKGLAGLPGFRPSEGFADRVAARAVRAARPATVREGALARLRRACWPRAERRLAFGAGLATGPVAVVAAAAWVVFSRPMVTLSNLSAFAWSKASAAASSAVGAVAEAVAGSPLLRNAYATLDGLGGWGPVAGAALVVAAASGLLAAWVLYKNVVAANEMGGEYASA